jgi:hypothetical protein
LFPSVEDEIEFLDDWDLDIARAELLVSVGRLSDAADIHLAEGNIQFFFLNDVFLIPFDRSGRPIPALKLLLKDNTNIESTKSAAFHLREQLWRQLPFGVVMTTEKPKPLAKELLLLTEILQKNSLDEQLIDEVRFVVLSVTNTYLCSDTHV